MQPDHRANDGMAPGGRTGPESGPADLSARQDTISPSNTRLHGLTLALVGFLVLFLELACIRWFAANVIFLQFFTNVVFIACFLGMSCGCLTSQRRDWLARFPFLAVGTFAAAVAILVIYRFWQGLSVDVGHQPLPQEVFYGTEYRNPDVAQFVVPIELIAGLFFALVALLFVGLGQVLGRSFNAYPNRVRAYTWNIGGSLIGIAGFSALSVAQAPPVVWFLFVVAGIAWLLIQHHQLSWLRMAALAVLLVLVALPVVSLLNPGAGSETRWSPYYAVVYNQAARTITVDTINHQTIHPFEEPGSTTYSLIHLLQQGSGGKPFQDILIIGAGSGNDVAHALRFNPRRIDAVEIDPVIQDIGVRYHPDRPYQDPRVFRHLDDGRHFLRTTNRKYDLVVYGLVDSLILHSSYANLRLESYLFTDEAFQDVQRVLKPGGIFVTYNYFRQGWIVDRVAAMATKAFGRPPVVLSLPYRRVIRPDDAWTGFTLVVAGDNQRIAEAFRQHPGFWVSGVPALNLGLNGFTLQPDTLPASKRVLWIQLAPATLVQQAGAAPTATDDWPFLYLRSRLIPTLTVHSLLVMGLLGLAMVYYFSGRGRVHIHGRMFFLGAAFMLLEARAVVQLALLFGSTWVVNSAVFFTVLVLLLLANLYVLKTSTARLAWYYVGLFVLLAINILVPVDVFLGGGVLWRYVVPCALVLGPMLFAGIIFARSFQESAHPDQAFGSNIAGSVVGGFAESFSLLLGFRYLLLVAVVFYALSAWLPSWRTRSG